VTRFRVPLLTLGFCALAAVVLYWDVLRRAGESIPAHQREVDAYFSQAEDPRRSRPPLFDTPAPGQAWDTYETALKLILDSRPMLEYMAAAARIELSDALPDLRKGLERVVLARHQPLVPPPDPEELGRSALVVTRFLNEVAQALAADGRDRDAMDVWFAAFSLAQDFIRVGKEEHAAMGFGLIGDGAIAGVLALDSHGLKREDLAALCAMLDRLDRTRPALSDAFEWGRLYWKKRALEEVLREASLSEFYIWKDFGSRTLFNARVLAEVDSIHRASAERGRLPPWERVQPVPHGDGDHAVAAQFYKTFFCCAPNLDFEKEVQALEHRALLRVALALAWYEAEEGKLPVALQDLVPRYLPALPVSPLDGKPLGYADRELSSRDLKGKTVRWLVQRR
jgi:hypothetical protein